MGKHDIRLRRQRLTARGADKFRNYGAVLKQHEDEKRIKKIMRAFSYFLIILGLIVLIVIITRWEKRNASKKTSSITFCIDGVTKEHSKAYEVIKHQTYGSQEEPRKRC